MKTLQLAVHLLLLSSGILLKIGETRVIEQSPGSIERGLPPLPADMKLTPPLTRDLVPGQRALTVSPLNSHALVGGTVTLMCEAHAAPNLVRVLWYEFASTNMGRVVSDNGLILNTPLASRARIVQAQPNHFHLEISNISLSDAGAYACADIQSGPPDIYSGQMQLVVLGSNPSCTTTVPSNGVVAEGQTHTYTCEISYNGTIRPEMHWTGPNTYQRTDDVTDSSVISTITVIVDKRMDSYSFGCLTNFTTPPPPSVPAIAGNAPEYSYMHQFQPLHIYWPPKLVSVYPVKSQYSVGDAIHCQADGYPSAFYQWQNLQTSELSYQQTFTITSNMAGMVTRMKCMASNIIQDVLHTEDLIIGVRVEGSIL